MQVQTTGQYLVLFRAGASKEGIKMLAKAGIGKIAKAADFNAGAVNFDQAQKSEGLFLDELDAAVVIFWRGRKSDILRAS